MGYFFLTNSIEIPYYVIGALFSLIVLLLLVTFYPISSYFNIYGTMSLVFGLIFLIMFWYVSWIFLPLYVILYCFKFYYYFFFCGLLLLFPILFLSVVATAFPFSSSMPWVGRVSQTFVPAMNQSYVTFTAQNVRNQSVQQFLETFVGDENITCVPIGTNQRVSCQYNAPPPNLIAPDVVWLHPADVPGTEMNEYYNFTISLTARKAFIYKINITSRGVCDSLNLWRL
jgi:hypothetical protein